MSTDASGRFHSCRRFGDLASPTMASAYGRRVRFTLYYDGDLPPNGNAAQKQRIRRHLHPQIKELWTHDGLAQIQHVVDLPPSPRGTHVREVAGQSYASVVHDHLALRARLDILMLRVSPPGGLVAHGGDIDNRLKTLFDALSRPANDQMADKSWVPTADEQPLHCLLDDDRLITKVAVDTDRLLAASSPHTARITIRAHLYAAQSLYAHALFLTS